MSIKVRQAIARRTVEVAGTVDGLTREIWLWMTWPWSSRKFTLRHALVGV